MSTGGWNVGNYLMGHPVLLFPLSMFRGSVYDAVVMLGCGGVGEHPATGLDELLRITKPGKERNSSYRIA